VLLILDYLLKIGYVISLVGMAKLVFFVNNRMKSIKKDIVFYEKK